MTPLCCHENTSQILLFYTQQTTHNHASKLTSPSRRLFHPSTLLRPPHLRRQETKPHCFPAPRSQFAATDLQKVISTSQGIYATR
ncbi:hypothetical protein V5799_025781 [Amblyomma americanum]|uniref:Uncharacterized protein n=1 Tax=Amblyomma americanum TaxID=6943 RepID=A0AAQ4E8H1_AMBAM